MGICTSSVNQGESSVRATEQLIKEYGKTSEGGMIKHVVVPDDFMSQQETLISNLVALAEDPLMKVIVTNNMFPGNAEAYRRIRARRPDIILLGSIPLEDPLVDSKAADLVLDVDFVARGYTIPWVAKQLGAKAFVHISFPRHMSLETFSRRRAIMEQACKDLGLRFTYMSAPDPTSDAGVAGAQQFLLEKMPQWIEQFGGPNHEKVAFFCTNDAEAEPVIKSIVNSKNGTGPSARIIPSLWALGNSASGWLKARPS
jgi:DNA-binding LacI/PurR family transcriptional regulator